MGMAIWQQGVLGNDFEAVSFLLERSAESRAIESKDYMAEMTQSCFCGGGIPQFHHLTASVNCPHFQTCNYISDIVTSF
jgi:hypothetical protein